MSQSSEDSTNRASQFAPPKYTVLLDTDIGDDIDDALALALILQSSEIDLKAVTTVFGDTQQRARLAAYLLRLFGREDIPVAAGRAMPLQVRHSPSGTPQAAAVPPTAVFPALSNLPGPDLIIQTASKYTGQLVLICIGPLTNVATALVSSPEISTAIRSIVLMGGSSGVPLPDWNIRSDVRAAQIVLRSGIPITMMGLNITLRCPMRATDVARLSHSRTVHGQLLSELLEIWQQHRPRWHLPYPYLHDPLTVAALCSPSHFRFHQTKVKVLDQGILQGFTVPYLSSGEQVDIVTSISTDGAREWIMQRLLAPTSTQSAQPL
ncbi:MAG: nucleoside hydrolase [Ktedonobacteraceae bacterium]|nr:nucleoside hydrolase [Ktedonobacteraceae bacterium]